MFDLVSFSDKGAANIIGDVKPGGNKQQPHLVLRAKRDIKQGEELLICTVDTSLRRVDQVQSMKMKQIDKCPCSKCDLERVTTV